ncbi:proton-conducting transporter membrane subunit [Clostridium homopropionicum]|nr:proton-conducting transporter membrane subunit [Clostridium homopropionicum]
MFFYNGIMRDPISIFFAIIIVLVFVPIFIYSKGYTSEYIGKYSVKYNFTLTILFVFSMLCVVFAGDSITFLVFWEVMSAVSFFIVIYEHNNKENIKSGIMYFMMTHISGLFLMIMFAFIYKYTGSTSFQDIYKLSINFDESQKYIIFIFAILGFGAKAGIIPLHAWLPKAHPSAPSNGSALMSGLMLKVALYGLIRVTFTLIGIVPLKLALLLVVLGSLTAIYSVLNAIMQKDIKRFLAYSSAENIGIILSSLGLSLVFYNFNLVSFANLTLTAALFHILNHAIFKSLLFANAGSVLYATGTKNMNELGGLYKKMKFAAICAFIGTAAISAIPPLNGFTSEILIFKCFIIGTTSIEGTWTALIIIASGLLITLTSGVTLYASVKSFGITYLGAERSEKALKVHKIPLSMNLGLGLLAFMCIAFGVFSPYIINLISKVSNSILSTNVPLINSEVNNEIMIAASIFFLLIVIIISASKVLNNKTTSTIKETWGCGFNNLKPYMQYSGDGYSQPLAKIFGKIVGYSKEVKISSSIHLRDRSVDNIEKYIYGPTVELVHNIAAYITKIHFGKIQAYVAYIFISLIVTVLLVNMFI